MLNGLTTISLVLFLATLFVWLGSAHYYFGRAKMLPGNVLELIGVEHGGIHLFHMVATPHIRMGWDFGSYGPSAEIYWKRPRFFDIVQSGGHRNIFIPLWWFLPFLLPLPLYRALSYLILGRGMRAVKRRELGLCPICAYDVRATLDRCPECGRVNPLEQSPEDRAMRRGAISMLLWSIRHPTRPNLQRHLAHWIASVFFIGLLYWTFIDARPWAATDPWDADAFHLAHNHLNLWLALFGLGVAASVLIVLDLYRALRRNSGIDVQTSRSIK
jgi:hypothetical protein